MFATAKTKNGLSDFFSSLFNWGVMGQTVDQPRFTFVDFLSEKGGGPEPESYGIIYRDGVSDKEYLVKDLYVKAKGVQYYDVFSIKEIASRPAGDGSLTQEQFKNSVILKPADIDVQNEIISFLKAQCEKDGEVFEDRRKRETKTGHDKPTHQANKIA